MRMSSEILASKKLKTQTCKERSQLKRKSGLKWSRNIHSASEHVPLMQFMINIYSSAGSNKRSKQFQSVLVRSSDPGFNWS